MIKLITKCCAKLFQLLFHCTVINIVLMCVTPRSHHRINTDCRQSILHNLDRLPDCTLEFWFAFFRRANSDMTGDTLTLIPDRLPIQQYATPFCQKQLEFIPSLLVELWFVVRADNVGGEVKSGF